MAAAYRMIDGDATDLVPEIKPIDQRTTHYVKSIY